MIWTPDYKEVHSRDGLWFVDRHGKGWRVVIAGKHVATFYRRSDARAHIRGAKKDADCVDQ